ncbi:MULTISPECIES: hypothetical protein [Acinetobacter]|uniref:Uncharacterized protein n=1 Tax=Acinetobacter towneri TaxID=202956 RepID=A0ABX7TC10_9GAMM|nr:MULTISPECIES: hypothetical protein [Acinetobacter]ENV68465.1 hypothetical protein F947_02788 [Acinetobacter towneri DSM 14962 = CIP 107472]MCA4790413.1 hypothetical protein [Acinetobacter towneri]MCO8059856.1 hypothetical protein [Acinetobacter towneri]MCO8064181.1 hypothetical protein [Acinetobacter towneri]MDD4854026.1 hypothetical protein [Acinetobacter towneri]
MVQLIKKGGLRERANRSRKYQGSENTEATLRSNRTYQPNHLDKTENTTKTEIPNKKSSNLAFDDIKASD